MSDLGLDKTGANVKRVRASFALAVGFMAAGGYGITQVPDELVSEQNMRKYIEHCDRQPYDLHGCLLGQVTLNLPNVMFWPVGSLAAAGGLLWYARHNRRKAPTI